MLSVHEDDSVVTCTQEMLGRGGSSGSSREVVQEADAVVHQHQLRAVSRCRRAHTLCSSGTVVPPLCKGSRRRISDCSRCHKKAFRGEGAQIRLYYQRSQHPAHSTERGDKSQLTVIRTTLLPSFIFRSTNSLTCSRCCCSPAGGACWAKNSSAENKGRSACSLIACGVNRFERVQERSAPH